MRNLHQTLHLQHHRHTGRLLHHRHTSYRALAVVFVVAGLFIVGLNMASRAAADDFGVAAMVAAPVPTNPPIISSPSADSTVNGPSALVIGSCPLVTPQPLVSITVDGTSAGTGACDSRNDFSVPVTLTSGNHAVTASALTVTGGKGPTSQPVQIHTNKGSSTAAIAISSAEPFVYAGAKDITWAGSIGASGQGNVFAHIDWGDNSQTNVTVQAGPQQFTHHYAALASHNILVAASNTAGATGSMQFASSAFTKYTAPVVAGTTGSSPFSSTVMGLYGLYVSALAVTGIVWLEAKHAARQHALQHVAA